MADDSSQQVPPGLTAGSPAEDPCILALKGDLDLEGAAPVLKELRRAARRAGAGRAVVLDLSGAGRVQSGVLAVIADLDQELKARGVASSIRVSDETSLTLLQLIGELRGEPVKASAGGQGVLDQVGTVTYGLLQTLEGALAFIGEMLIAAGRALRRPSSVNWPDVVRFTEKAGADGFPIVFLMSFLVGMVMGFTGAVQLRQFGADIYLADLVGLATVRELGPLMAAIIVAGRSGAAFAAELGTMQVSEEVSALRTMGVCPYRFLVFPRMLALVIGLPLLTLIGDLVGVAGGMFVGTITLDLAPRAYLIQSQLALSLADVGYGVLKSFFFAAAIGAIACERGMATSGGAEGVGRSTTSSVVAGIFHIVLIDAAFAVIWTVMGW